MYSFIVEKKGAVDLSVTGTYMRIVQDACAAVGEIEFIKSGKCAISKRNYIVTDTILSAAKYFAMGYKKHIVWMQGVAPEESYMRNKSTLRFFVLSMLEKFVLKRAKLVILVSEEMLSHYEEKYGIDLSDKSVIMPCFNETELVEDAFNSLKYARNTFAYVGSLHAWQCFEQTVKLYADIENLSKGETKLFVYTFHKEQARALIQKYGIRNYVVDCVGKEELSERIKGIKYGFVLREDCAVNNVATPTKFSNYLANGIIPIYSSAVRSFAEFDKINGLGIVCDLDDLSAGVERILLHMRGNTSSCDVEKKCKNAFDSYYNAGIYTARLYEKLKELT